VTVPSFWEVVTEDRQLRASWLKLQMTRPLLQAVVPGRVLLIVHFAEQFLLGFYRHGPRTATLTATSSEPLCPESSYKSTCARFLQ
jgi:hypothetical protein